MMSDWTNTANSRSYYGQIFSFSSLTESFKSSKFWNLKIGVFYVSFHVQENLYLAVAFEASDWAYGYCPCAHFLVPRSRKLGLGGLSGCSLCSKTRSIFLTISVNA